MSIEELQRRMEMASSQMKLATGIGNNAAWCACLEAHDKLKKHKNYRHRVKHAYKQALKELKDYERRLIYATENPMFCMSDMSAEIRKIYGTISDRDYYEFWAGTGAAAYRDTRPLVTSLVNKYRLSLLSHGIDQSDITAWGMAAMACLKLAQQIYDVSLRVVIDTHGLPPTLVKEVFWQFKLERVATEWKRALELTEPACAGLTLDSMEARNIELGIIQLQEAWGDTSEHLSSVVNTIRDFDDVFRTKGEMNKAIREIEELKYDIDNMVEN